MTFGFESSLPTPRFSAAVIIKSKAKFLLESAYSMPLVGTLAPRLVTRGIVLPLALLLPPLLTTIGGVGKPGPRVIGLGPTPGVPPMTLWPLLLAPAKAN